MMARRKKVAIIGGGPSGLTTAYWLTSTPELREQYDVTIYQMGWRLGGKGASGRNREQSDRVEEHGLHIIFGFYQNFFAMIREVYGSIRRPPEAPLSTWRKAFHPLSAGIMEDYFHGQWQPWYEQFPRNNEVPGTGSALNGPSDYLVMLGQLVFGALFGWKKAQTMEDDRFLTGKRWEEAHDPHTPDETVLTRLLIALMNGTLAAIYWIDIHMHWMVAIVGFLRRTIWQVVRVAVSRFSGPHRLWTAIDLGYALLVGIVRDKLFEPGNYDAIDEWDFRDWLGHHGAHKVTMWSPYTRAIYDAAFSYNDGRSSQERISASVAIRTIVRMLMTFKGAMYFKMQAGMGDTVFGPLHEALTERGVTFRFFHKTSAIHLNADRTAVSSIDIQQQADLLSGDPTSYAPLYDVLGLPCWPSEPLYEQIANPAPLKDIDLESYYSGYAGVRTITLNADVDFDTVVIATPVQTLPFICADYSTAWSERWRAMAEGVKAVQTISFQLWLAKDLVSLGWDGPESPLLSLYVEPYNTWSDMSQVLDKENWPANATPLNASYFTGAQPGPDQPPAETDLGFPADMKAKARAKALEFLEKNLTTLLPGAAERSHPESVDWSLLVSSDTTRHGMDRFETQYWRSNCDPHERCTLALPGTGKLRIAADDTGYRNLVISGDWIDNGIHVACMEGAVMGGIYAARAVSGVKFPIVGETLNSSVLGRE